MATPPASRMWYKTGAGMDWGRHLGPLDKLPVAGSRSRYGCRPDARGDALHTQPPKPTRVRAKIVRCIYRHGGCRSVSDLFRAPEVPRSRSRRLSCRAARQYCVDNNDGHCLARLYTLVFPTTRQRIVHRCARVPGRSRARTAETPSSSQVPQDTASERRFPTEQSAGLQGPSVGRCVCQTS